MSRSRPHQIRVNAQNYKYAKRLGKNEATDGLETIFNEHRVAEEQLENCKFDLLEMTGKRDQVRALADQFAEELQAAAHQRGDLNAAKADALGEAVKAHRRRKLWRGLFWGQLVAWPVTLAMLDAVL